MSNFFPDDVYFPARYALYSQERLTFANILAAVPNYFYTEAYETSTYGAMLQAVAKEQARLEWRYQYDVVSRNPKTLYPHDMKRQWAGPLFVSRSYPTATQTDSDYRNMLVDLIAAFRKGATASAIADVIKAYTGQTFYVEELYRQIGKSSYYDQSDRNAIRVSVYANARSSYNNAQVNTLSQDLYDAIDLAKPAHVGINLTSIFGLDENIGTFVTGITDQLQIRMQLVEGDRLEPMLTLGPLRDPKSPDTRLAPQLPTDAAESRGLISPRLNRAWEISDDQFFASDAD
jgi:hypothetical protein